MLKKIPASLEELVEEGILDDVISRLLSGKEASIFIVERQEEIMAAKVYKERTQRSFKNVASYVEGRNQTRNSRDRRAKNRKTNYGKELMETSWREMEYNALQAAYYAGVRVPQPFLLTGDVLLMELLVDEAGDPAPRLADLDLNHSVAGLLHQEVFQQVRRLLTCGLIHGDLSAYNILMADNGLNLIDMPQIVDASANNDAREILHRDLQNVTDYLARFDRRLENLRDCGLALFRHFENGTLDQAEEPETAKVVPRRGRRRGNSKRARPPQAQEEQAGKSGDEKKSGDETKSGGEKNGAKREGGQSGGSAGRQPAGGRRGRRGGRSGPVIERKAMVPAPDRVGGRGAARGEPQTEARPPRQERAPRQEGSGQNNPGQNRTQAEGARGRENASETEGQAPKKRRRRRRGPRGPRPES